MLYCDMTPNLVFGWELEAHKRKPSIYPILEIMKSFCLSNNDILVLDGLKPGMDMARSCHVTFAGAGWSHIVPEIENYMRKNSDYYFSTVESFGKFVLEEDSAIK